MGCERTIKLSLKNQKKSERINARLVSKEISDVGYVGADSA